jgi:dienelactone hydrolase
MKSILNTSLIAVLTALIYACNAPQQEQASEETEKTEETTTALKPEVVGEEVTYATENTSMNGYIAYDQNKEGKRPGILVVHEWWGHNDYTRERANMLAELGYTAIAVDMYGDGKQAEHPDDAGKFAGQVFSNLDEAQSRFTQAIETLKSHETVDGEKIAAIGYCFGGSIVLSMANAGYDLDAVAAFHSGVQLPVQPDSSTFKAKVLVCNGGADPMVTAESVEAFKASMDAIGADYDYIAYDSVVHAFTNPGADALGEKFGLPLAYNAEADKDSWNRLTELLKDTF